MIRVVLVGSGFDEVETDGTTLDREDVEIRVVGPTDPDAFAPADGAPRLVVVDTRSAGERTESIVRAIRDLGGAPPAAIVLAVPGLDRERWENAGADGLVTRPLTTARLLDAVRRHAPMAERGADRAEEVLKVELASSDTEWVGFTRDVAVDGAFVHGSVPFENGEDLAMRLHLPGEPSVAPFEGRAVVVRVCRGATGAMDGVGLRFSGWSASDRGRLARWLREKGKGTA